MRKCTDKEWNSCRVEKLTCAGCYYASDNSNERRKEMSRKLASVQKVKAIKPIEGADRIEVVQVLNWNCVAKKGEYQVGDMVVYFEIDSLLPDIPAFEWLKGSSWSQKLNKYKISTHKFRNQISQGLVIPIDQLETIYTQIHGSQISYPASIFTPIEGEDLTEALDIEKYEPPVINGSLGETLPHAWYVPKTDEERVQVCAENVLPVYMKAEPNEWYASIKVDGSSCTAGLFDDAFLIGGRNHFFKDENMYKTTVNKYGDLETKLKNYLATTGKYLVFQGELCGPGIQSNRMGLPEKEWLIFNVFESTTGEDGTYTKCDFHRMAVICEKFGLRMVPIVPSTDKFDFKSTDNVDELVDKLLAYVDNFKYRTYFGDAAPSQIAEGIVFRMNDMTNSFKVVSNKYLLKNGE